MSYQAALDYIKLGRERGLTDADIASRLRGVGWHSADVQDAFALLASMGRMPEPVARLASTPVVLERPVVQPAPEPQPQPEPTPQPVPHPSQAPVVPTASPAKKRSMSLQWVGWIAIVIAAFVLGYMLM